MGGSFPARLHGQIMDLTGAGSSQQMSLGGKVAGSVYRHSVIEQAIPHATLDYITAHMEADSGTAFAIGCPPDDDGRSMRAEEQVETKPAGCLDVLASRLFGSIRVTALYGIHDVPVLAIRCSWSAWHRESRLS